MFCDPVSQACQADTHWLKKLTKYSPSNVQMIFCFCFALKMCDVVPVSGQISERARGQNLVFFLSIWKNCDSRFGTKLGNKVVKTRL